MKKLFLIAILTCAFCCATNAQTPTPQTDAEIARVQLVNALERAQTEVKTSRKYIDALQNQVEIKQSEIKALNQKGELADAAIVNLQSEITNLRAAITEAEAALKIRSDEVGKLKKDLEKTRRKLARVRNFTKYLAVAAGVLAAALVLK